MLHLKYVDRFLLICILIFSIVVRCIFTFMIIFLDYQYWITYNHNYIFRRLMSVICCIFGLWNFVGVIELSGYVLCDVVVVVSADL